ncbi:MAG: class I SAM-dependent methyltransferase [Verrucomicrobiales bacterium]|nr:class I SAM-dependent methyltransferase [Verrucomicrobiales bacterium]
MKFEAPGFSNTPMNDDEHLGDSVLRSCPVCQENDGPVWLRKGTLQLVRCRRCDMIYANPVESELASGKFYDRLGIPFYLSPDKLQSDYSPVRFERELRLFRAYVPTGAVLDVGCSTGGFLFQLLTRFPGTYRVTGMDVASAALDYAGSRGIEVLQESFLDFDFAERRFDAVTFWAVLEHLTEPKRFLQKAASIIKPGGHCLILVPNMNSLAVRLLGAKYRYIFPDHVNYFTPRTLKRFVGAEPKLALVRLTLTHFNPIVILNDFRDSRARVSDTERASLLKRTTAYKQNPLLKPLQWVYRLMEAGLVKTQLADNLVAILRRRP